MIRPLATPVEALVPRHVALVMDGTRRWSHAAGRPVIEGYRRAVRALQRTIAAAVEAGIAVVTVQAFGDEDLLGDDGTLLADVACVYIRREIDALVRGGVRVRVIGRRERLGPTLAGALADLERRTAGGEAMLLNLAVDYSARAELCIALRALAADVAAGRLEPEQIDDAAVAARLWTAGVPDPDLLIRTGGDLGLSNFLLYQCAYTELWSTRTPWPEFDGSALRAALAAYAGRQRRFGR